MATVTGTVTSSAVTDVAITPPVVFGSLSVRGVSDSTVEGLLHHSYEDLILLDDPISYFFLEEIVSGEAIDEVNSTNGTVSGVGVAATRNPIKSREGSFYFDGVSDDVVSIDHVQSLLSPDYVSLEAWIRHDGGGDSIGRIIWLGSTSSAAGSSLYLESTNHTPRVQLSDGTDSFNLQISGTNLADNNWHHVVATYDRITGDVFGYLDGQQTLVDNLTISGSIVGSTPFALGIRNDSPQQRYSGHMGHAAIYDYVLSESEVKQRYDIAVNGRYVFNYQDGSPGISEVGYDSLSTNWRIIEG